MNSTTHALSAQDIDRILSDQNLVAQYHQYAEHINPGLDADKRSRAMVMAILSANVSFSKACQAYLLVMAHFPHWESVSQLIGVLMAQSCGSIGVSLKARGIMQVQYLITHNPGWFFMQNEETTWDFVKRVEQTIPGLGLCKAMFAVALMMPFSDICCIDRHILRVLLPTWTNGNGRGVNELLQKIQFPISAIRVGLEKVRELAYLHHIPVFLVQWIVWDASRGHVEDHAYITKGWRQ